jgi:hypothetical protein
VHQQHIDEEDECLLAKEFICRTIRNQLKFIEKLEDLGVVDLVLPLDKCNTSKAAYVKLVEFKIYVDDTRPRLTTVEQDEQDNCLVDRHFGVQAYIPRSSQSRFESRSKEALALNNRELMLFSITASEQRTCPQP